MHLQVTRLSFGQLIICLIVNLCNAARINYHNYKLYKFEPKLEVLEFLRQVEENGNRFSANGERMPLIDFFSEPNRDQKDARVLVAPEFNKQFLDILNDHKVDNVKLVTSNIQGEFVAEQNAQIKQRRRRRRNVFMSSNGPQELRSFDVFAYNHYDVIVNHLKAIASYKPEMVTFYNITKTFENRDMVGLKITSPGSKVAKPSVFIDGGVHAREWISVSVSVYMIDRLVNEYETNPKVKWMLDAFDWWIVPVANPDGYIYSMETDRLWRKSRSRNEKVNKWCRGADLNRNWSFRWGQTGSTRSPCSNTYSGERSLSEREVSGLKQFIDENVHNLKVYTSFHAYGQLILSPWGYTSEKPINYMDQKMAAQYAVNAIRNSTGATYTYGTIAEVMYPASGTSIDYMASQGVPYVYGIELRPLDDQGTDGFTVPPSAIEATGRDMMAALLKITEYVNGQLPKRLFLKRRRQ